MTQPTTGQPQPSQLQERVLTYQEEVAFTFNRPSPVPTSSGFDFSASSLSSAEKTRGDIFAPNSVPLRFQEMPQLPEPEDMAEMMALVNEFRKLELHPLRTNIRHEIDFATIEDCIDQRDLSGYKKVIDACKGAARDLKEQAQRVDSTTRARIPGILERLNATIDSEIKDAENEFQQLSEIIAIKGEMSRISQTFRSIEWNQESGEEVPSLRERLIGVFTKNISEMPLVLMQGVLRCQLDMHAFVKKDEYRKTLDVKAQALQGLETFCGFLRSLRNSQEENDKELIQDMVRSLSDEVKNEIYKKIWVHAGEPQGNPSYGEDHVADDLGVVQNIADELLYNNREELESSRLEFIRYSEKPDRGAYALREESSDEEPTDIHEEDAVFKALQQRSTRDENFIENPEARSLENMLREIRRLDSDASEGLRKETIGLMREVFSGFSEGSRNRIYTMIWEEANRPMGNPKFGEENLFTDLSRFARVVENFLREYRSVNQ